MGPVVAGVPPTGRVAGTVVARGGCPLGLVVGVPAGPVDVPAGPGPSCPPGLGVWVGVPLPCSPALVGSTGASQSSGTGDGCQSARRCGASSLPAASPYGANTHP